jgi:hypothetical protein
MPEKDESDLWWEELKGLEKRDVEAFEFVSKIKEFHAVHSFLDDEDFTTMLNLSLRVLTQPHLKAETARDLLIKFQAASVKFNTLAIFYTTLRKGRAGTDDNYRKNMYYAMAEQCDKMAQSLKYIVRRYSDD